MSLAPEKHRSQISALSPSGVLASDLGVKLESLCTERIPGQRRPHYPHVEPETKKCRGHPGLHCPYETTACEALPCKLMQTVFLCFRGCRPIKQPRQKDPMSGR